MVVRPRLRRWIGAAGTACLSVSAFCFASEGALRADPLLAVRLHLPFAAPRLAIDVQAPPSPAGSPSPAPRRRGLLGDGPIVVRGDGTYHLGLNRGSRNGFAQGSENYGSARNVRAPAPTGAPSRS